VFKSTTYVNGRRKPKAAERSAALLKQNQAALTDAEVLVRILNDTIEQGHAANSGVPELRPHERLARAGVEPRSFSAAEIAAIYEAYEDILAKWQALPVGGAMQLRW